VVIAGGGVTGWSVAAALARSLGAAGAITVLESESDASAEGAVVAAGPDLTAFHARLGLDEASILRAARGACSLGERVEGFAGEGAAYFRPFGEIGAPLDGVAFHQLLLRRRAEGRPDRTEAFSLNAIASELGRFARPAADERTVLSTLVYGLNLDARLYAKGLRQVAASLGVSVSRREIAGVETCEAGIGALRLSDGGSLEADLFIDCTGPASRLLGEGLGVAFDDWSGDAPVDGQLNWTENAHRPTPTCSRVRAAPWGWRRTVPLQGADVQILTFSTNLLAPDQAQALVPADAPADLRRLRFGRRRVAWAGNCIGIGEAAAAAGPLDAGPTLAQRAISRLLELFPTPGGYAAARSEFNRRAAEEMDRVRDAALLPLRANGRSGEAFWDACREGPTPASLRYRLDLWESRGRVISFDEEPLPESDWVAVLMGQGPSPRRLDVLAQAIPGDQLDQRLRQMQRTIRQAAEGLPPHDAFLAGVGAFAKGTP